MKKILVSYSTNNSGGSYWLKDKDWDALENAGWRTYGFGNFVYEGGKHKYDSEGFPEKTGEVQTRIYGYKHFSSIKEALQEFENLTGQSVTDEGCNCCGAPHSFSWEGGYCSGEDCGEYLLGEDLSKVSKRELLERLRGKQD